MELAFIQNMAKVEGRASILVELRSERSAHVAHARQDEGLLPLREVLLSQRPLDFEGHDGALANCFLHLLAGGRHFQLKLDLGQNLLFNMRIQCFGLWARLKGAARTAL